MEAKQDTHKPRFLVEGRKRDKKKGEKKCCRRSEGEGLQSGVKMESEP